ncbi:LLM class F420-dependent oxidoreductase [Micromonospora sediminicola]|uniref:LLM class F420-dependent oxidoreductase n=1 Tax=Micromonospora sediminicola TaxID=946078 RepID=UPI0033D85630
MRLALNLGYHVGRGSPRHQLALTQEAQRLGFSIVWVAEAYGSDAPSVLGWLTAHTNTIGIGSAVLQIPARTPAMTAMTTATLDMLSSGRFHLGLGVSGPQVVEGWHGVPFWQPLTRTREYVAIVRSVLRRERLVHDGASYQIPLPGGRGKALQLMLHPHREQVPIYLGAAGPRNLELTGEIADGWLPPFFSPAHADEQLSHIRAGRARAGKDLTGFDIAPTVAVVIDEDLTTCVDRVRPYIALYIGGMGSRRQNFYNQLATRMGFGEAARDVQSLYLSGDVAAAAAAVPPELVDAVSLLGPPARIARRLHDFAAAGVTTLVAGLRGDGAAGITTLRQLAEAAHASGVLS